MFSEPIADLIEDKGGQNTRGGEANKRGCAESSRKEALDCGVHADDVLGQLVCHFHFSLSDREGLARPG
jgi:hypothetical protein